MSKQYSVTQLARDLDVTTQHVRRYLKEKRIAGRKVGNSWVISSNERERLLARKKRWLAGKAKLQARRTALEEDPGEIERINYVLPT